ncbi:TPA: hypothetical protein NKZ51_004501 [Vibrio parahaemolyticus]|nr:hypothetical protein [Vibrio parahaemolyticus]
MKTSIHIKTKARVICHRNEVSTIETMLAAIYGRGLIKTDHFTVPGKPFVSVCFSLSELHELNTHDPVEETEKAIAIMRASSYQSAKEAEHQQAVESATLAQSMKKKLIAWLSKD